MGCCKERSCRRKTPLVLRQGGLSGRWYLGTRWVKDGKAIVFHERHDVTLEVQEVVIAKVLSDLVDAGVDRAIVDRIADKYGLKPKPEAAA